MAQHGYSRTALLTALTVSWAVRVGPHFSPNIRPHLQPRPPWQCGKQAIHIPTAPKVQNLKVWTLESGQQCAGT